MQTLHTQYYQLRKKILALSLTILFISFILIKFLVPDYFVKENALQIDSGIMQYAFMNKHPEFARYAGTVYKNCLDVVLENKPYYIRFTDQLNAKYWATIRDSSNFSKPIEVKFQRRLLHDGILYNPNEVLIDNKVVIPSDSQKGLLGWLIIGFTIFIIAGSYFLTKLWKQYKEGLYWQDKQIAANNKWELISVWIND